MQKCKSQDIKSQEYNILSEFKKRYDERFLYLCLNLKFKIQLQSPGHYLHQGHIV